jgi:DNA-binding MarR family transcriptional regulator
VVRSSETVNLPLPDYEADDVLVVAEPEQLRALGGDLRTRLVVLLRDRARSTSELARELGLPTGTVGHHVKVLERAGLIRVVRTRKVRAVTESYYGRVARLFILKDEADGASSDLLHARLTPLDARRYRRRLERLAADFLARDTADGDLYGLVLGLHRTETPRD